MRKIYAILSAVLLTVSVFLPNRQASAQAPQKMSYQAVIRNSSNALVTNTQVGMQISILQGSASGTAVYTETQIPTTNANGLVSIEIGGTAVFEAIDWANDIYFIKTETDPAGGTNYTITGTSQLLSVPYALYAKKADNGITNAQANEIAANTAKTGITAQQASDITANNAKVGYTDALVSANSDVVANTAKTGITTVQSNAIITNTGKDTTGIYHANRVALDLVSGTNTGDQTISRTGLTVTLSNGGTFQDSVNSYTAGTGIDITNKVISTTGSTPLAIGDNYGGGIIFWLDATGQHGLIAATTDQSTGLHWYNGSYTTTNAVRDGIGAGMYNTERIIANQSTGSYAAQLCANYQGGGYGDWYLPSKYELNLLYLQKTAVGGFVSAYYWSSLEYDSSNAWLQYFHDGTQGEYVKYDAGYVRAIRAF